MQHNGFALAPHMKKVNSAHGVGYFTARAHESGKIMRAHGICRGPGHGCLVQRLRDAPVVFCLERVIHRAVPDAVKVFFALRAVARVKIVRHLARSQHADIIRQKAV